MKLAARDTDRFLNQPPAPYCAALIYGPDHGLVAARSRQLAAAIAPDLDDPFSVTLLDGDGLDAHALADATHMLSFTSQRRLVWLRNAGDGTAKAVEAVLADATGNSFFLVIEGGDLGPRSALRKLCEASANCAAIACYHEDEGQLAQTALRAVAQAGWQLDRAAAQYLAMNITGDYALARREIDKLVTYLGKPLGNPAVTREMVMAVINDGGSAALDDLADACFIRQPRAALRLLDHLLQDGVAIVLIIRSLMRHAQRLYHIQVQTESGTAREEAIGKLSPPLFFKRRDGFLAQLSKWPAASLERALALLGQLEQNAKNSAYADEVLLRQAILQLTAPMGR